MSEGERSDFTVGDAEYSNVVFICTIAFIILSIFAYLYFTYLYINDERFRVIVANTPRVYFITPAAVGAFIVVALFRKVEGLIKFNALGFKFEGASGPIVMWVLCFLAVIIAIKMLG